MNRKIAPLLLGVITVLFAGCGTPGGAFVKRSDKIQSVVLRTVGEPGQHFTAKLKIDGVARELSGVSPAEFPLETCVLTGTVRKTHGDGTLRFEIREGRSMVGFANLTDPGQSCRFRYHANGIEVWQ
jgi:hypothetical protein